MQNKVYFFGGVLLSIPFIVMASSFVVISQVLFDPSGPDTGLEYVTIKNIGTTTTDISGWSLYPDGIGYFTFPSISLTPGTSVMVSMRSAETDTSTSLHFADASGNMGNSSGSIALFSSKNHSSDTIVSYVRYHKPGSGEHKTWESSAIRAGLWRTGSYIDISSLSEGQVLTLSQEDKRMDATGWMIQNTSPPPSSSVISGNTISSQALPQAKQGKGGASVSKSQKSNKLGGGSVPVARGYPSDPAGRVAPMTSGATLISMASLGSMGQGLGAAFLGVIIVVVIKTLFARYNKNA